VGNPRTGLIARTFAADLRLSELGVVTAVGSRSQETAERFAQEFGVERPHASYEPLVEDPAVDVVYVATPLPMHRDNAMLAPLDLGVYTVSFASMVFGTPPQRSTIPGPNWRRDARKPDLPAQLSRVGDGPPRTANHPLRCATAGPAGVVPASAADGVRASCHAGEDRGGSCSSQRSRRAHISGRRWARTGGHTRVTGPNGRDVSLGALRAN
jgi:hypothetical protein